MTKLIGLLVFLYFGTVNAAGILYQNGNGGAGILKYDGSTGEPLGAFGNTSSSTGMVYGNGKIYQNIYSSVRVYDTSTGDVLYTLAGGGSLAYGEGILYQNGNGGVGILKYDGITGELLGTFGDTSSSTGIVYGDGRIYQNIYSSVRVYDASTGEVLYTLAGGGSLAYGEGILYQNGNGGAGILKYDGITGELLGAFGDTSSSTGMVYGDGKIYQNIYSSVRVYDASTGDVLYTLAGGGSLAYGSIVPIPAAVWLFGSGLGLLGWVRYKRD